MTYQGTQLFGIIHAVRRRRTLVAGLRGLALTLAAGAGLLTLAGLAAYRFRYHEGALLTLRLIALAGLITAVFFFIVRPLRRRVSDAQIARLIEERHRGLGDRLVSAVEFSEGHAPPASASIVERLVEDAGRHAGDVSLDEVVSRQRLWAYGGAAAACVALFVAVVLWGPRPLSSGIAQLVTPASPVAAANALQIAVKPGTARVPKGSDQRILATLVNFSSEAVTVFSRKADKEQQWFGQAMEPAKAKTDFQYFVFNIQEPIEYYVEANGVKSETFRLDVADLPYVKQLDLVLTPPAYTGLPAKTMEDSGDVAALAGTGVRIIARLTGKAKAARIVLRDGKKIEMGAEGAADFAGSLSVSHETSYHIEVVSLEGETYNASNEHDITVLSDQPPTVSFEKPGRDMRATNVEEVFTQAKAEDDYGVSALEMYISVNGGDDQKVDLQRLKSEAARTLSGAHTFFLEEYGLKPGDFISYYAKARDARNETTSDIYFIEIKPFEREFRQAQQQGGGQGGGEQQNALTRRQKEIIAATFRVVREQETVSAKDKTENYNTVALGQERLRDDTNQLIERIRRRVGGMLDQQPDFAKLVEHLTQAAKEMDAALGELKGQKGKEALGPEQRALQQLLRADAIFRDIQVAMGSSGGGGNSNERAEELADLFELELDKMKNQYETLQREQRQQGQQQEDELKRKLEELARRQQQQLEQQQRRQQGQQSRQGGGGGGSRQQQEMADEARQLARELERLSRERRDQQMQELSRQLDRVADALQRQQAAGQNSQESIAQGLRALQQIEDARRRLEQQQQSRGGQSVEDLKQRAAGAAQRQQEIAKDVEELARRGKANDQAAQQAKRRLAERKDALANEVNNLEKDIDQTARGLGQEQQQAGQQLRDAASSLRRNRVADRIKGSKQMLENDWYDAARTGERTIQENLNEVAQRLQEAARNAGRRAPGGETEDNLERTRRLADDLDSLRRRMGENQRGQGQQARNQNQQSQNQQGQQPSQQQGQQPGQQPGNQPSNQGQRGQQGQQPGQQPGQQGQQQGQQPGGQQQNGQQSAQGQPNQGQPGQGQAGGQRSESPNSIQSPSNPMGGGPPGVGPRQLGSEIRERIREAEDLRRGLGRDRELGRDLDQAIQKLREMSDGTFKDDTQTAALLKTQVIDPLRRIELELSRRLQAKLGRNNLRLSDEGAAPERYRKLVDEYYKRLSNGSEK